MALHKLAAIVVRPRLYLADRSPVGRGLDGRGLQPQPPIVPSDLREPRAGG